MNEKYQQMLTAIGYGGKPKIPNHHPQPIHLPLVDEFFPPLKKNISRL